MWDNVLYINLPGGHMHSLPWPAVCRSFRRDFSCDTSLRRREMPETCADKRRTTFATLSNSSGPSSGTSAMVTRSSHAAGKEWICASNTETRSFNSRRCRIRLSKYVWPKLVYAEKASEAKHSTHNRMFVADTEAGDVVWTSAAMVAFSIVSLDLPPMIQFNTRPTSPHFTAILLLHTHSSWLIQMAAAAMHIH